MIVATHIHATNMMWTVIPIVGQFHYIFDGKTTEKSQLPWALFDITLCDKEKKTVCHIYTLTHWGQVTHICIGNLTIIGSDNGLAPGRRQAITWTNDGILLIGPLWTNFSEILSKIYTFSLKKMHLKTSSAKRQPFCLGLNVLNVPKLLRQACHISPSHMS